MLVADTDHRSLSGVGQWLRDHGLNVALAGSASDASAQARARPFDLILCDARLLGPDGRPFLESLRGDPATRDVPVVLLTDGNLTAADAALTGLVNTGGPGGPVLGVVSRTDLGPQHLRRWLGDTVQPLVVGGGPALARVTA